MTRLRFALSLLTLVALGLAALAPAGAARASRSDSRATAAALLGAGEPAVIAYDQASGVPTLMAGELPQPKARAGTPLAAARGFFGQNAALFRMTDPAAELAPQRQDGDRLGFTHVRLQQRFRGVEVFGAVMVAHVRGGQVESVGGTYIPNLRLGTTPRLALAQAADAARAAVRAPGASLVAERSGLAIYARGRTALTWKVELIDAARPGRWLVFIDAGSGAVVHQIAMLQHADRKTYTMANGTESSSLPGTLLCDEGSDAGCQADPAAKAAHDNAGLVRDYYLAKFGRDSIDGAGMDLVSSVHFDIDYNNAFWNGSQMVYGDGDGVVFSPLSQSLDVVAHELTHGVTEFTAGLVYEDESGALNESYSDVMGVFADAHGRAAAPNWDLGEDVYTPGVAGDALRDMADPHQGSDPFTSAPGCVYRVEQPYYCGQPASVAEYARLPISLFEDVPSDTGGVHVNSGIPNKAAYLLVEGGTFGGVTVAGIGLVKAEQIYYRTLANYLTPYSDFMAARNNTIVACTDLIGQFGITADDCASVRDTFTAVGIGEVANGLTLKSYLPAINPGNTPGIGGRVTQGGAAVAGVTVQLRRCDVTVDGSACGPQAVVAQAVTDSAGRYLFSGSAIPSTDDNTWYRVQYVNPADAPDGRLLFWISDDIGTYVAGTSHTLDTFDIADVTFVAPNSTAQQPFPTTFTWQARAVGGDYYFWELYDADFGILAMQRSFMMSTSPSFTLSGPSDTQLSAGSSLSGARYWDVMVVSKAGYGLPYNSGSVAFGAAGFQDPGAAAARRAHLLQRADLLRPQLTVDR